MNIGRIPLIVAVAVEAVLLLCHSESSVAGIYCDGWIDFDKNGVKDVYEDPSQPTDAVVSVRRARTSVCAIISRYHKLNSKDKEGER